MKGLNLTLEAHTQRRNLSPDEGESPNKKTHKADV